MSKRLRNTRPDCLVMILPTGIACVAINVAAGLLVGLALEYGLHFAGAPVLAGLVRCPLLLPLVALR